MLFCILLIYWWWIWWLMPRWAHSLLLLIRCCWSSHACVYTSYGAFRRCVTLCWPTAALTKPGPLRSSPPSSGPLLVSRTISSQASCYSYSTCSSLLASSLRAGIDRKWYSFTVWINIHWLNSMNIVDSNWLLLMMTDMYKVHVLYSYSYNRSTIRVVYSCTCIHVIS